MKKRVGRPSKLSDRVIKQVEILAGLELTEEEIAQVIGVTALTIRRWKTNREYCSALKRGKVLVDSKVSKTLVKRALGYSYKEITRERKDGKIVVTKVVEKKMAPDVVAMIFWLKNRRKDLWRDAVEKDINVKGKVIQELHNLAKNNGNGKIKKDDNGNRIANLIENE